MEHPSRRACSDDVLGRLFADRLVLPAAGETLDARRLPAHGGVCALVADDGTLIQLLGVQSLRRTLGSRLRPDPSPRRRPDLRAVARTLWWQPTHSVFETSWVYLNVARQLGGTAYRKLLGFGPAWCACLDLAAAHPRWVVRDAPFGPGVIAAGPFVTRKRCAAFIEGLEDLFDLCRYPEVLERAPHGQRCAYYDMGKCPAPCDGSVGMDTYRRALEDSARFATSTGAAYCAELERRMQAAAAALDFESAQRWKEKGARAWEMGGAPGRLGLSPQTCRLLVVQAGGGRAHVRPFFVEAGRIAAGRRVHRAQLSPAVRQWLARAAPSDNAASIDAAYRTECLWLISHFLAKGPGAAGVFVNLAILPDAEALTARLHAQFFGRSPRK